MNDLLFIAGIILVVFLKIVAVYLFVKIISGLSTGRTGIRIKILKYDKVFDSKNQSRNYYLALGFYAICIGLCFCLAIVVLFNF